MYLRVNKQPSANTIEVVDGVQGARCRKLDRRAARRHIGLIFDQSTYIRQSIESLWHESRPGRPAGVPGHPHLPAELRLDRHHLRRDPLSIMCTLIAMYFLGQTLNIFTLGGLALAVGRLVDDSIVELENINRHLAMPGKDRRTAVLDAAREVAMPIFVSTITTIVVFLPTVFLEGQAKLLFIPADVHDLVLAVRVVPGLADGHPADVPPAARAHAVRADPGSRGSAGPVHAWSQGLFDGSTAMYQDAPPLGPRPSQDRGAGRPRDLPGEPRARAADRHRVLPDLRREPVPDHAARPARHPGRGDGEDGRPDRGADPAEPPAG